ncbi:MAG TPA: VOC family protein [Candidatus Binataceae bacterium]|nr:VOC family protein [Candidatus Binataceae bacterium]
MVKFDHMVLPVSNVRRSRDWYVKNLGFKVEFERNGVAAIQDTAGFTIFLRKAAKRLAGDKITLTIQVKNVDRKHRELASAGIEFVNPPQRLFWGYGAELRDPDGYMIDLWDEVTMREKGGS